MGRGLTTVTSTGAPTGCPDQGDLPDAYCARWAGMEQKEAFADAYAEALTVRLAAAGALGNAEVYAGSRMD